MAEQRTDAVGASAPGHHGADGAGVALAEAGIAAAWNVQGDPLRSGCVAVVRESFGVELPLAPNTVARSDALTALWLGPRSWLLVAGEGPRRAEATAARDTTIAPGSNDPPVRVAPGPSLSDYAAARDALNAADAALFDVSAARVAWTVSGPRAADVLAKGCPLDFHPSAFAAGTCAQSVYGRVGVLLARCDDAPAFALLAPRSYARDVWQALFESAAQYGCDVLPPAPFGRRAGG